MITIIAAVTRDMALGRGGELLYRLRGDMKHFRELTMGHPIVMGRKTFESFPKGALPGRRNIVVSRNGGYTAPGIEVFTSLDEALEAAGDGACIIGGGEIYRQAMEKAGVLELTEIDAPGDGADTFFPTPCDCWHRSECGPWTSDGDNQPRYRFVTLVKE